MESRGSEKNITERKAAAVCRAARKSMGLTQSQLAKTLGVSQSLISKIESGALTPDLFTWLKLAELAQIPDRAIERGYIDWVILQPLTLSQATETGSFRLPKKYAQDQGTSVRQLNPYLYSDTPEIAAGVEQFLKKAKVEADYFVDLRNQINLQFSYDLTDHLLEKGAITPEEIKKLAYSGATQVECHGQFYNSFLGSRNVEELLTRYQESYAYYDCNYDLSLEGTSSKKVDLVFKPKDHLESFSCSSEASGALSRFHESFFENFCEHFSGQKVQTRSVDFSPTKVVPWTLSLAI